MEQLGLNTPRARSWLHGGEQSLSGSGKRMDFLKILTLFFFSSSFELKGQLRESVTFSVFLKKFLIVAMGTVPVFV